LSGCKFIAKALSHVAVLKESDFPAASEMSLDWIKNQPIWAQPNLVRMPREALKQVMNTVRSSGNSVAKRPSVTQQFPPQQMQQQVRKKNNNNDRIG
jgi:hypothetical protein